MSDNRITRVRYFERQFLRTQDFSDEQSYHVSMRRRHNVAHHTWGIASGLDLVLEEGNIYVQPGMAVDGYGRELILPTRRQLDVKSFDDRGANELDVWLVYTREESDEAPVGYTGCGVQRGDGAPFYRWHETARVRLTKPDPDFVPRDRTLSARRQPETVADSDLNFSPSGAPPEDSDWPVFLGQIIRGATDPTQLAVKPDDRPYVGLVGEQINSPSGLARVQVGSELAGDDNRFAVFVREDTLGQEVGARREATPQLSIDSGGRLSVRREATLFGNLTMAGGAIEFEAGGARAVGRPSWSIYHAEEDGEHALRVEMPAGGGANSVVVGAWFKGLDEAGNETEKFHPCLTVADDCTVTVHGDLVVVGNLLEARQRSAGRFTKEALGMATTAFISGMVGPKNETVGARTLTATVASATATQPHPAATTDADTDALAFGLEAEPLRLARFASRLKTHHPDLADKLRAALGDILSPDTPAS